MPVYESVTDKESESHTHTKKPCTSTQAPRRYQPHKTNTCKKIGMLFMEDVIQMGSVPVGRCAASLEIKDMWGKVHRNWYTYARKHSEMYPAQRKIWKKTKELERWFSSKQHGCRGPRFCPQDQNDGLQLSITPIPEDLMLFSGLHGHQYIHTDLHTYIHMKHSQIKINL